MPRRLTVDHGGRFLRCDGQPWFLFADTGWELFHRLGDDDTDHYLTVRADQGFNAVLVVAVGEFGGTDVPNAEGRLPFVGRAAERPDPDYWAHVDRTIAGANARGLFVGLLPSWGSYWSEDDEILADPEVAARYASWIAGRYADAEVFWVLGGDRNIESARHRAVVNAMAAGIRSVVGDDQLITYHARESSKDEVGAEDWVDFDIVQSGHHGWCPANYQLVEQHYTRPPLRPVIDGEPNYEAHPVMDPRWHPAADWTYTEADARRAIFHAAFAGACGHAYGAQGIYQFLAGGEPDTVHGTPGDWRQALHLPGARQVAAAVRLLEEIRFADWEPRQDLLMARLGFRGGHARAVGRKDATAAAVYAPWGRPVCIDLSRLDIAAPVARWWDPRTATWGALTPVQGWPDEIAHPFDDDAVLIIADRDDPAPGLPT